MGVRVPSSAPHATSGLHFLFKLNVAQIGNDINKAGELLKKGECVGIPTETVYGLAANALNVNACLKIFKIKERPSFDPLIVHVSGIDDIEKYVEELPEKARILFEHFSPGPLTIVLKKKALIPDIVTSGLDSVGIRIPNHPLTLELLKNIRFPIAAPSANPFGYISPTTAIHVNNQLGSKINYILDGGNCNVGIESTIIGFNGNKPCVLRLGGLSLEKIEAVIGKVNFSLNENSNPKAPGQMDTHYAPRKNLYLLPREEFLSKIEYSTDKLFIAFTKECQKVNKGNVLMLSENEDLDEAAYNLFSVLRKADESTSAEIIAELVPDNGLGLAINDRLRRASVRK